MFVNRMNAKEIHTVKNKCKLTPKELPAELQSLLV